MIVVRDHELVPQSSLIFDATRTNQHAAKKPASTKESGESACKPGSVVNSHSSGTCVTARLKRPTRKHARALAAAHGRLRLPYLALLQVGFAMPSRVTTDAVRSYRTVSPLPALLRALRRSTLCCTFRGLTPPRDYLAPCPPSPDFPPRFNTMKRSDCPADSPPRHLSMPLGAMTLNRPPPFNRPAHRVAAAAPARRLHCV